MLSTEPPPSKLHGRVYAQPHTAIDLLIDKWGLHQLLEPGFGHIIRTLVRRSCFGSGHVARLLLKYDPSAYQKYVESLPKLDWARDILSDWLIEGLATDQLDEILATFILSKAEWEDRSAPQDSSYATIAKLVKAGANINTRVLRGDPESPTALHYICAGVNRRERWREPELKWHSQTSKREWLSDRFLPFLIENGADPTVRVSIEGKAALDALVADLDEFATESARKYVRELAEALREYHEGFRNRSHTILNK